MPSGKRAFKLLSTLLLAAALMTCAACGRALPGAEAGGPPGGDGTPQPAAVKTAEVPILMYHNISDTGDESTNISRSAFEEHMRALDENGYTTVSFFDLLAFVERGEPLPEKPVVITFDDGYLSNYESAFPVLERLGMKATIFVIGTLVGHTTYKDTDYSTIPRFDYDQAREMVETGLISIQSHTYDMHQWASFETRPARENILRLRGESKSSYTEFLKNDHERIAREIESATGQEVIAVAYPLGARDRLARSVLTGLGVRVTLTTDPGINTVKRGNPRSLIDMHRFGVRAGTTVRELLEMVGGAK